MRIWLMMFVLIASGPVGALTMQSQEPSDISVVILAPWRDGYAVLAAMAGREIGPVRAPFALLVQGGNPGSAYEAGALWVANGSWLTLGCGGAT